MYFRGAEEVLYESSKKVLDYLGVESGVCISRDSEPDMD